jgi:hypothetical protein
MLEDTLFGYIYSAVKELIIVKYWFDYYIIVY